MSTVASTQRVTKGQSVASGYLGLIGEVRPKVTQGNPITSLDLCAILGESIDATGSRKEAAADMGISGPVLTKQLQRTDDAAPRLDRMNGLKRETLIDFAQRILAACDAGDPRVARQAAVQDAARALGQLVALAMGQSV